MDKRQVAVITGGARGIGLGISQQLAFEGYNLAICGRKNADEIQDVLNKLKDNGIDVHYTQCDVSSSEDRENLLKEIKAVFGKLNILVNNAGVAPKNRKDLLEATEEEYEWLMKINLQGPYFLTQSVANWMIEQKNKDNAFKGSIINISSISAEIASIHRGEYCVSKAGLHMMTQLYAARLGEFDIPVYEIQPGIIKTDMTSSVTEKYNKLIDDGLTVQKRWGNPEDIGKAVAALARGDFMYSTGATIKVDGGLTVGRL